MQGPRAVFHVEPSSGRRARRPPAVPSDPPSGRGATGRRRTGRRPAGGAGATPGRRRTPRPVRGCGRAPRPARRCTQAPIVDGSAATRRDAGWRPRAQQRVPGPPATGGTAASWTPAAPTARGPAAGRGAPPRVRGDAGRHRPRQTPWDGSRPAPTEPGPTRAPTQPESSTGVRRAGRCHPRAGDDGVTASPRVRGVAGPRRGGRRCGPALSEAQGGQARTCPRACGAGPSPPHGCAAGTVRRGRTGTGERSPCGPGVPRGTRRHPPATPGERPPRRPGRPRRAVADIPRDPWVGDPPDTGRPDPGPSLPPGWPSGAPIGRAWRGAPRRRPRATGPAPPDRLGATRRGCAPSGRTCRVAVRQRTRLRALGGADRSGPPRPHPAGAPAVGARTPRSLVTGLARGAAASPTRHRTRSAGPSRGDASGLRPERPHLPGRRAPARPSPGARGRGGGDGPRSGPRAFPPGGEEPLPAGSGRCPREGGTRPGTSPPAVGAAGPGPQRPRRAWSHGGRAATPPSRGHRSGGPPTRRPRCHGSARAPRVRPRPSTGPRRLGTSAGASRLPGDLARPVRGWPTGAGGRTSVSRWERHRHRTGPGRVRGHPRGVGEGSGRPAPGPSPSGRARRPASRSLPRRPAPPVPGPGPRVPLSHLATRWHPVGLDRAPGPPRP